MSDTFRTPFGLISVTLVGLLPFSAICAFVVPYDPQFTPTMRVLFAVNVGLVIFVMLVGHFLFHEKPDLEADLLAKHMPVDHIRQLGVCHIILYFVPAPTGVRGIVLAQNQYLAPAKLWLWFEATDPLSKTLVALKCDLLPGELLSATIDAPITAIPKLADIAIRPDGRATRAGPGPRVRFARRPPMQTAMAMPLVIAVVVATHHVVGEATLWKVKLPANFKPAPPPPEPPKWITKTIWSAQTYRNDADIAKMIKQAITA